MQERFHTDPIIRATELLLHEKFPDRIIMFIPPPTEVSVEGSDLEERAWRAESITTPHSTVPRTRIISNGRYSVLIDNVGSGMSFFDRDLAITRWREDPTLNRYGYYIFIEDKERNRLWSNTYQPTLIEPEEYEVIFNPDKVEFKRTDYGLEVHTEITVSPEDQVEIRRVSITNLSGKKRVLEVTSYAEVSLAPQRADMAHPAFSKMFIESEFLSDYDALLFRRRMRSVEEEPLYLFHMATMRVVWQQTQFETSRMDFLGRGRSINAPIVFAEKRKLAGNVGPVLDPIYSIRVGMEIEPGQTQTVTFTTGISHKREEVLEQINRYREIYYVTRAFEMAWSQSNIELRHEAFTIGQTHTFQHLANGLLFNVEKWRGGSAAISKNQMAQNGLWRFGISGDLPIVVFRLNDSAHLKSLRELLLAHHYLRARGLVFDIVVMNEYPGGYFQDLQNEIESLAHASYSGGLLEKRGGVFLRTASQLSPDEMNLLLAVARVVIYGAEGSLGKQLQFSEETVVAYSRLWWLTKQRDEDHAIYQIPKLNYEFFNGTGGFVDNGEAYAIEVKQGKLPPLPWTNVVANPKFGFICTESGGGYTWSENSRENRLSPWSNDPVTDWCGEAVYIRDTSDGSYWSATPRPSALDETFLVKHGFGFSEYTTQISRIFSSLTLSGSVDLPVKWWNLRLVNGDAEPRTLEVLLYFEWTLGVLREDSYRHIITGYDAQSQIVHATNNFNNEFASRTVFLGSSLDLSSFTTNRTEFLGRNGTYAKPILLERGFAPAKQMFSIGKNELRLSRRIGAGFDSAAVLKISVQVNPGEERLLSFFVGEVANLEEARKTTALCRLEERRQSELKQVQSYWRGLTRSIEVKTPQRSFDVMLNGWLLYQTLSCRMFARSAFYQSGGAIGFRDQLQDSMALLYIAPNMTKQQVLLHAQRQFVEGDVQHWWHPPTGRGVRTRISDDFLWLPYVVDRYLETTGDHTILEEQAGYIEGPHLEPHQHETYIVPNISSKRGSIYEHCIIAIDRALVFGAHGIPIIGCGDWNDGFNEIGREGKGESVWMGWFLYQILSRFAVLVESRRDSYRANEYRIKAELIRKAIDEQAWDGEWYRRAFFDDGTPVGSKENDECKIDSIAQSWSVISGAGEKTKSLMALESANKYLVRKDDKLILLLDPPFDRGKLKPGYIKGYLPGIRENGGQYTHAATWLIMAEAMLGHGSRAVELFEIINPINHTSSKAGVDRYMGEPYVTCGDVYSVPPHVARAGWSWYTGSSSWLYRIGIEFILGLRVLADHIEVKPSIPNGWGEFQLTYRRKNATYNIQVLNPNRLESGATEVTLDDTPLSDGKIPLVDGESARTLNVKVTLK